jgi:hypothetical protein
MTMALDELSKRMGNRNVDVVLTEALRESRGAALELCILSLVAVGDLTELIGALSDKERPDVRWQTIVTLPHFIARSPATDVELFDALRKAGYSAAQAQTVMDLLHGFSEDDTSNPEVYATLIEFLRHEKLPVRELAWRHLLSLWPDGKKIRYDPAGSVELRDNAYQEWKTKIPTGKLPPKPAGKQ